jgi:hypothetical protein
MALTVQQELAMLQQSIALSRICLEFSGRAKRRAIKALNHSTVRSFTGNQENHANPFYVRHPCRLFIGERHDPDND